MTPVRCPVVGFLALLSLHTKVLPRSLKTPCWRYPHPKDLWFFSYPDQEGMGAAEIARRLNRSAGSVGNFLLQDRRNAIHKKMN